MSVHLAPPKALGPRLRSRLVCMRDVRASADSILRGSYRELTDPRSSVLDLPELLTKDISISDCESSPHNLPLNPVPLANGDLFSTYSTDRVSNPFH